MLDLFKSDICEEHPNKYRFRVLIQFAVMTFQCFFSSKLFLQNHMWNLQNQIFKTMKQEFTLQQVNVTVKLLVFVPVPLKLDTYPRLQANSQMSKYCTVWQTALKAVSDIRELWSLT